MVMEVLWEGPEEELDAMEEKLIEVHDTIKNGYNIIPGGGFNPAKDPASLQKMREGWASGETRAKQKASFTASVRKRMSESQQERCRRDGNKQMREAAVKGCMAGNKASQTPAAKAKAKATRERTRKLKAEGVIAKGRRSTAKSNGLA
jgi:predicted ThiF/HesA family dinucleotide-utilizing enzyme